jgi:hypothetical protein
MNNPTGTVNMQRGIMVHTVTGMKININGTANPHAQMKTKMMKMKKTMQETTVDIATNPSKQPATFPPAAKSLFL